MKKILESCRSIFLFILVLTITSIPTPNTSAQNAAITLDHLEGGSISQGLLFCDQQIIFYIRASNYTGNYISGIYGVFQVYSPDNAMWTPIVFDTADIGWKNMFDGLVTWEGYSVNGSGSDTIGFFAFEIFGGGFQVGFDSVAWTIETYIDCSETGKTICLDSVTNARGIYEWLWAGAVPTWDGPHCFTISGCCTGVRGNVNPNGGDNPNILDLSWAVGYIFRGLGTPGPCPEESDVNGDGAVLNILDLTYLVNYIFRGGPLPGPCQ